MAQPRDYTRQYNFNDFQATNPDDPLPGNQIDAELNTVKLTLDDLNANIAKIQRDDGKLGNTSVHKDAFDQAALALINSDFTPRGDWVAARAYAVNDAVDFNGATYVATVAHTSSAAFATDDAADRWLLIANAAISGTGSAVDKFEGDGNTTAFTLSYNYTTETAVQVFVNGELLNPVDDYTISGTTLTLFTAPGLPVVAGNENVIVWGASVVAQAAAADASGHESNASGFADEAEAWASKTNGIVESTDYSSKAWATGGTGVDGGDGSAKDWATKTTGTVGNTTEYSSKYWATQGDVPIVASNIADITTVAGQISPTNNVSTLASISANITTTAGVASDITVVSGISSDVTTVSNSASAVGVVSSNISSVNTVATNINAVVTVANDLLEAVSEIETVANDLNEVTSEIEVVANNIATVNTVGGISGDVTTVAGISSAVSTVSGINAAVSTLSGLSSEITTLNNINSSISSLGAISSDITTVSGISSDVSVVATNVQSVANFADKYEVGATTPSSPTEGLLWFDTSTDTMKVYNGSSFQNAGSSVNGTSSRGTFTATSGQTVFTTTGYDSGFIDIFMNGVKLVVGTDVTATNGTTFTLTTGAAAGDVVEYVAYGTFQLNSVYTQAQTDARYLQLTGGTVSGDLIVGGNLTISGSTTTVNSTTLDVADLNITVADGAADAAAANGAGLTVDGANATFNYAATGDKWTMNKPLDVTGDVTSSGTVSAASASITGSVTAASFNGDGSGLTGIGFTTNVVTTSSTASANNHYYLNAATLTLTLPASPSVGDEVRISEVAGNTDCVIGRNGSNIMGDASDLTIDTAYLVLSLRYVDATIGWAFS